MSHAHDVLDEARQNLLVVRQCALTAIQNLEQRLDEERAVLEANKTRVAEVEAAQQALSDHDNTSDAF